MESHVLEKLAQVDRELVTLVNQESALSRKISNKTEHKKLSIF